MYAHLPKSHMILWWLFGGYTYFTKKSYFKNLSKIFWWLFCGYTYFLNLSNREMSRERWRQMLIMQIFLQICRAVYVDIYGSLCGYTWLFLCMHMALLWLFCGSIVEIYTLWIFQVVKYRVKGGVRCGLYGVFGRNIWLFYGFVRLICEYIWLFCGLFVEEGGVRCGLYGVVCGYTWLLQYHKTKQISSSIIIFIVFIQLDLGITVTEGSLSDI